MKSLKCQSSQDKSKNDNRIGSWLKKLGKGATLLLTYELIEELIEEAIAWTITTVIAKALSVALVIFITQGIKCGAKGLVVLLKPIIKKITYKTGNDKITKIKRFIDMCKEKIRNNKFLQFLKRNPKSIVGVIAGVIASLASGVGTTGALYLYDTQLPLWAKIVCGCGVFIILLALTTLGVTGAGFENKTKLALREIAQRLGFGKAVDALAKVEEEFAVEQEKIAEAEKKAEEERIAKYSNEWKNAIARGDFDGSLNEYIDEMVKKEEEIKKAQEEKIAEQKAILDKQEWKTAVLNGTFTGSFAEWENK